jgi:hypothetical protein
VLSTGTEYRHGGSNLLSQEVGATSICKQSSAALQWDSSIDDQAAARLALLSNRERTDLAARDGDVPAMRVLLEVCRRQALLNGLDQPQTLHIESPRDTAPRGHIPTLREVLPPELAADTQAVREQALLLHRALPMPPATGAGGRHDGPPLPS